jgi:hypothetical protein
MDFHAVGGLPDFDKSISTCRCDVAIFEMGRLRLPGGWRCCVICALCVMIRRLGDGIYFKSWGASGRNEYRDEALESQEPAAQC